MLALPRIPSAQSKHLWSYTSFSRWQLANLQNRPKFLGKGKVPGFFNSGHRLKSSGRGEKELFFNNSNARAISLTNWIRISNCEAKAYVFFKRCIFKWFWSAIRVENHSHITRITTLRSTCFALGTMFSSFTHYLSSSLQPWLNDHHHQV